MERHRATGHIGLGYLKGYGLKTGAVASSIAHDSHNIIAVGTSDETLALAVNAVIDQQGGIAVVDASGVLAALPLPVAGLMSDESLETVNALLSAAKAARSSSGPAQIDPFMTLSFMIFRYSELKLTTRGMFDGSLGFADKIETKPIFIYPDKSQIALKRGAGEQKHKKGPPAFGGQHSGLCKKR